MDYAVRFWSKVDKSGDCWVWTGTRDVQGYGKFWGGQEKVLAHRVAYELLVGPIPADLVVDHLCFNPPCVNPRHLRVVTRLDNSLRQRSALKTHCINGHAYDEANTYFRVNGRRDCRPCIRIRVRRYQARRAA